MLRRRMGPVNYLCQRQGISINKATALYKGMSAGERKALVKSCPTVDSKMSPYLEFLVKHKARAVEVARQQTSPQKGTFLRVIATWYKEDMSRKAKLKKRICIS